MIIIKIGLLVLAAIVLPTLLGEVLLTLAGKKHNCKISYLMGTTVLLGLYYLQVNTAIKAEGTLGNLTETVTAQFIIVLLLTFGGSVYLVWRKGKRFPLYTYAKEVLVVGVLTMLVSVVSFGFASNAADYTEETVNTMYFTDSLYSIDPTTGKKAEELSIDEIRCFDEIKQSSVTTLYAVAVSKTHILPSKFVNFILPILIFPLYICTYLAWGEYLFPEDTKKRAWFQMFVWILLLISMVKQWDVAFDIFASPWNGETMFFLGIVPMSILVMLNAIEDLEKQKYFYILFAIVLCFASKLLYRFGLFMQLFMIVVYLGCWFLRRCSNGKCNTTA